MSPHRNCRRVTVRSQVLERANNTQRVKQRPLMTHKWYYSTITSPVAVAVALRQYMHVYLQEFQMEFEARTIGEDDYHGIRRLLQQVCIGMAETRLATCFSGHPGHPCSYASGTCGQRDFMLLFFNFFVAALSRSKY